MRQDLLFALRNMAANRGVFAVAILTLALGIGVNTAMFSVVHAVLLRPLPLREPGRLVTIRAAIPRLNIVSAFVEYNMFGELWRARCRSFESMAAFTYARANLTSGDQPQRLELLRVSAGFLSVLGTRPAFGRDFRPEEDQPGAQRVAILSDSIWKQRFGADRGLLGRSIVLDNASYTVVGVLPPDFDLNPEDVLTPIAQSTARAPGAPTVGAYARLKPGVSVGAAQAEIDALSGEWTRQYNYPQGWQARVWSLRDYMVRNVRLSLLVLAAAVVLVQLIACANVANLLLTRAGARQREIAIRGALGAGSGRITRQLLTESALLAIAAAAFGLLFAWIAVRVLVATEVSLPFLRKVSIDGPVLGFTLVAALVTTVLFGLAPALAAAHTRLAHNLKEGSRAGESMRRTRFRSALVAAEVALALLLLVGATLTIRSLSRLQEVNPGFNPASVLTAKILLPRSSYAEPARRASFFKTLLERVTAMPGVESAGMVSSLPFGGSKSGQDIFYAEGAAPLHPGDRPIAFVRTIDPAYFRALQVRLIRGSFFTPHDSSGPPVAIVNETLARRLWPNQDPIGRRFGGSKPDAWLKVVGVIADMRNTSLADPPDFEFFIPHERLPGPAMSLVVRTARDPMSLASTLRAAVRELDKDLPLSNVTTLEESISRSTGVRRLSVALLGVFALLALLLAAVGIYGVVSYSVTLRTHEIGLRMALGAAPGRIAGMIVGQAVLLGAAGVAAGIAGSLGLTRLLGSMLYGVSATDPAVFAAASFFLLAIAALSAYLPARRASRVDPLVALRHE